MSQLDNRFHFFFEQDLQPRRLEHNFRLISDLTANNGVDLTASRLLATDSDGNHSSTDLNSWVTGTANRVTVTDDGDGTITLSGPQDLDSTATPTFAGGTFNGIVNIDTADANTQLRLKRSGVPQNWYLRILSTGSFILEDNTGSDADVLLVEPGAPANSLYIDSTGNVGLGIANPPSALSISMATENLEFVDAGSTSATQQDWIQVEVGGNVGYLHVFASK